MHLKPSIIKASWDGLCVKYVNVGIPLIERDSLIIGIVILDDSLEQFDENYGAYTDHMREYLLFILSPFRFEQMIHQKVVCFNQCSIPQIKITDPSILHMANLLIAEIQYPNPLSKQFVNSIVTIVITNCLLCLKS